MGPEVGPGTFVGYAGCMIGVFDSGVGGLTVLQKLREELPLADFLYLGDTARLPYGNKSPLTIKKYLHQNIQFLLAHKVDAVIVACNSASSVIDESTDYPVPVYSVIEASAHMAVKASLDEAIGVIATRTTVEQKAYVRELQKINPHVSVYQQACPLLVPLAEEGMFDDPITNLIVYRYLTPVMAVGIDTLILGCTHYPLLTTAIRKVIGSKIKLVSSADAIAIEVKRDLENKVFTTSTQNGSIRFFTTDINQQFKHVALKLFPGQDVNAFELVNIS